MDAGTDVWTGRRVRFGDLSGRLGPGPQLADVRVSGRVMLDAVELTLRATDWSTPPLELVATDITENADESRVSSSWRGVGEWADVTAFFTLVGGQRTDLVATAVISTTGQHLVQRAGLCLLHPLELLGTRFLLSTADSDWECEFTETVSPVPPYPDFVGLSLPVGRSGRLRLDFGNTAMEMEDHRNWTDAGWKSYHPPLGSVEASTPLTPGHPRRQQISLAARPDTRVRTETTPPHVVVGLPDGSRVPPIGTSVSACADPVPTYDDRAFLSTALQHLHVELADGTAAISRFRAARRQAQTLGRPLRLTLGTTVDRLPGWISELAEVPGLIEALCLVDATGLSSSPELISTARKLLERNRLDVQLGGGTRGYLADLSCPESIVSDIDYVQFSVSGQVHHVDPERVMGTTRTHPTVLSAARRRTPGRPIAVGPITIEQRMSMHRDPLSYAPYSGPWPTGDLVGTSFSAAWCLAAVAGLRDAAVLTMFDLTDGAGLVDRGEVSPAGAVLAELALHTGTPTRSCTVSAPRQVSALALAGDAGGRLYLANRRPEPVDVAVEWDGATSTVELRPYAVVSLSRDGVPHPIIGTG